MVLKTESRLHLKDNFRMKVSFPLFTCKVTRTQKQKREEKTETFSLSLCFYALTSQKQKREEKTETFSLFLLYFYALTRVLPKTDSETFFLWKRIAILTWNERERTLWPHFYTKLRSCTRKSFQFPLYLLEFSLIWGEKKIIFLKKLNSAFSFARIWRSLNF